MGRDDSHHQASGILVQAIRRVAAEQLADEDLLAEWSSHQNEAAFAAMVRRHQGAVMATIRKVLPVTADAEDAFQAVFLALAQRGGKQGEIQNLAAWLVRVAKRAATKMKRKNARRREEPMIGEVSAGDQDDFRDRRTRERLQDVLDAIELLRSPFREIAQLIWVERKTQEEVARELKMSDRSVRRHLSEVRKFLRQGLPGAAVPADLTQKTITAAICFALGEPVGLVPARVIALAKALATGGSKCGLLLTVLLTMAVSGGAAWLAAKPGVLAAMPGELSLAGVPLSLDSRIEEQLVVCERASGQNRGRAVGYSPQGKLLWAFDQVHGPTDARPLGGGRWLIVEPGAGRVTERGPGGNVLREFPLDDPLTADRLPNGNLLVVCATGRLLEVTPQGAVTSSLQAPQLAFFGARVLSSGTIVCAGQGSLVEIDRRGREIRRISLRIEGAIKAEGLPDGNFLVTAPAEDRVVEVDPEGNKVRELRLPDVIDASPLVEGSVLVICDRGVKGPFVAKYAWTGKEVWRVDTQAVPVSARVYRPEG